MADGVAGGLSVLAREPVVEAAPGARGGGLLDLVIEAAVGARRAGRVGGRGGDSETGARAVDGGQPDRAGGRQLAVGAGVLGCPGVALSGSHVGSSGVSARPSSTLPPSGPRMAV